ncbi:MAG TPA: hypothetical protein VF939_22265 [Puia sp.]
MLHYKDYAAIEEKLRSKGFVNDVESGVICRYTIHGITVDVMPTSENILYREEHPTQGKDSSFVRLAVKADVDAPCEVAFTVVCGDCTICRKSKFLAGLEIS